MGAVIPHFWFLPKMDTYNQMRIVEISPDRISECRGDSDFMIGLRRKSRKHLTRIIVKRRRVVALSNMDKERVFGGAWYATPTDDSSKYCPPSATTAHEGSATACRS